MSAIAVTGATGFVGGAVADVLSGQGHDVVCLVRRDPGDTFPWPNRLVDPQDAGSIARGLEGCDAVVHLAIPHDFHAMYADRRTAQDGYVGLTRRVVDAAHQTDVLVGYVSTDRVFDGTAHLVDEAEPPNPVNFYRFLKAASELVVLERATRGFVARVGGVQGVHRTRAAGPRVQDVGFGYFVLALVDTLAVGGRFLVWEDPEINSVATPIVSTEIGALLGLAVEKRLDGVLHLAGATVVTRRELALTACEVFGLDPGLLDFGPPPPGARLPAPVPYDTSPAAEVTMARLGARAQPIQAQLNTLRAELEGGVPAPISRVRT